MRAAAGAGPGRSQGSLAVDDAHGSREDGGRRRGRALRRANVRLALFIGAVALAFYALMLVTGGGR